MRFLKKVGKFMKQEKPYKIKYEIQTGANGKEVFKKIDFGDGRTWVTKIISYDDYLKTLDIKE